MLGLATVLIASPAAAQAQTEGVAFFEKRIRPILVEHCYDCHGPETDGGESGLVFSSRASLLRGGRSGPAIRPGKPAESLLVLAVRHDTTLQMPPKRKLRSRDVRLLEQWVAKGAAWPPGKATSRPTEAKAVGYRPRPLTDQDRRYWAFQPLRVAPPPLTRDADWPRTRIDRFVLSRLEQAQLRPAPPLNRTAWLRRVTLHLTGLPPTPREMQQWRADRRPGAHERAVDRLLASPRYGERWGRRWLDVARYADSNGMDDNLTYADAWRYRNYVIASFNRDGPFDRFLTEQLAGDLLVKSAPQRRGELLAATGFLMIGPKMLAEDDPVKQQMDLVDEQLDTTFRAFLGLTIGCARCHDHKFDPLPSADYYALAGIFKSTQSMLSYRVDSKWCSTALDPAKDQRLRRLEQIINHHDDELVNGNTLTMTAAQRKAHENSLAAAKREYAAIPKAMAVRESGSVVDLRVHLRGNHLTLGPRSRRATPRVFAYAAPRMPDAQSGRLQLARWMTDSRHPLTARVLANRIWSGFFGRGIVETPDNFGRLGARPTHPELLDYLARRLLESGWSLKSLQREIALSAAYAMDAKAADPRGAQVDPENRLLWKMPRQRLEAEMLRDCLLAAARQLDYSQPGKPLNQENFVNLSGGGTARKAKLYERACRSVYLPVLRSAVYDVFQAFDFPDPATVAGKRNTTTVAPQALFMMNSRLVDTAADQLAARLVRIRGLTNRLRAAYRRCLARDPRPAEVSLWREFLSQAVGRSPAARRNAEAGDVQRRWTSVVRVLFASNEFLYLP